MDQQSTYKINSFSRFKLLSPGLSPLFVFASLFFSASQAFAASDFILPPSHQSTYSIEKYGSQVGNMHNELKQQNGRVSYTSETKATGFASFFVKNDVKESSLLNWSQSETGKTLQQQSYRLFRGKKHKKNQKTSFDWNEDKIVKLNGSYKNRTYQLSSDKHIWGRHLLPLLMSNKLLSNSIESGNTFYITDKGGFQKYIYTLEKSENMVFSGKDYPVLKFKLHREGSSRMSYTWLSSAHYYLPLKIEQYKDGELNVSMLMTELKITDMNLAKEAAQKLSNQTNSRTIQAVEEEDYE